ncbi:MAG: acyl-CoA reductase-like NAD-dependent aldehyde dehydrogenase [Rhodothermales bacterium]|jgi:acyl-CoA reductase-like NAD-dependent aldehyde dehydrogenase
MSETFKLLVPGAQSAGEIDVLSPYDLSKIASIETGDEAAVEIALATADALNRNRDGWKTHAERIGILERAADIMTRRAEELAVEAAREGGKPLLDSRVEVARAIDGVKNCVEVLRTEPGYVVPMNINAASMNRIGFTSKEPIGVVVAVSAFNHPLNLIVHQVCPAVATGCPVVVKPSSETSLSCMRFIQILHEAGLEPEWAQAIVTASRNAATQLVADRRVDFFSFIGSAEVGWTLRSKLSPGARCALEHGGVAPVIVARDAILEKAVPPLVKGGFYHAGQVCVSVQRVFAHESIARELAERMAAEASKLTVGDPTSADTDIGPLIRPREVDRVEEWVNEAVAGGAEVLCGGKRISDTCYACTMLWDPRADAKVSTREVFGPVVCVYPYSDMDEAIARANALTVSFQAAVFTEDLDTMLRCYKRLNGSAVMVNDHTAFRVDWMPFAGLKESGHGVGGIPHTMHEMQVDKLLMIKSDQL